MFIGAGGAALKLLQLSGIPESKDYAGFPVGGQFLSFENTAITKRHNVKAYGMAESGSPPMSVPHLDARKLDGKSIVLFGPFCTLQHQIPEKRLLVRPLLISQSSQRRRHAERRQK